MVEDRTRVIVPYRPPNPAGQTAISAVEALQDLVNLGCQVRNASPSHRRVFDAGVVPPSLSAAIPQVREVNRQFWRRVCGDPPANQLNQDDVFFPGGQCPTLYNVSGNLRRSDGALLQVGIVSIQGPIRRIYWEETITQPASGGVFRRLVVIDAAGGMRVGNLTDANSGNTLNAPKWIAIFRADGQIDSCGNAPPQLPSLPPPAVTVNVNATIGGIQGNVQVNLPDLNVNTWPNFTFSPHLQIGDIDIYYGPDAAVIDAPGIALSNILSPSVSVDLSPVLNATANLENTVNVQFEDVKNTINNNQQESKIDLEEIKKLIECCACEEGTLVREVLAVDTPGGTFDLPENTKVVEIIANEPITPTTRIQSGSGNSPDIYFWGSYSVGYRGSSGGDRLPLHFIRNAFRVEKFASAVSVMLNFENKCSVYAYRLECEQ